jgi:DNA adenine methylase
MGAERLKTGDRSKNAPLLKWPGGKRWLTRTVVDIIVPRLKGCYFEPFLGGGAVFFALRPTRAILSDVNQDLILTYRSVREQPDAIVRLLRKLPVNRRTYYSIRAEEPTDPIRRAARFLYLNRTAFGGIYRLNGRGGFNVPYGGGDRTTSILWERQLVSSAAKALSSVTLRCSDFESVISRASSGDVVYCDPTYTVAHNNNGFVRYNEQNFSWNDQERLAAASRSAVKRGATVIISNACHDTLKALYPRGTCIEVERKSLVSAKTTGRRTIKELLIVLPKLP